MGDVKTTYMKRTPTSARLWKGGSKVISGGVMANIKYFDPIDRSDGSSLAPYGPLGKIHGYSPCSYGEYPYISRDTLEKKEF